MSNHSKFIRPIQFYFAFFISIGLILLAALIWSFYSEGNRLQQTVNEQTREEAKKELTIAVNNVLLSTQNQLQKLAKWDEVHQQYHDPSYYFFWHDDRLKESHFYQPYYDQLELYTKQGKLLMPPSKKPKTGLPHRNLPNTVTTTEPKVILKSNQEAHMNVFAPIFDRSSHDVLGYVGVSLDIYPAILTHNQFYYLDKTSLRFPGDGVLSPQELIDHIEFKPISNPINSYLWELIERFIAELIVTLILLALTLPLLFKEFIHTPLTLLSEYLQRLRATPYKKQKPPKRTFWIKEFEELKNAIYQYHHNLQKTQLELDEQNLIVWEQARRDALTNIYNRRAFDETWNEVMVNFQNEPIPTAFMLFDCDFFKALNDTYGHEVGDKVIQAAAKVIQQTLPMENPAYRIGGDEFAVILQHRTQEEIEQIAQQCLDALSQYPYQTLGIREKLPFSVGISSIASSHDDNLGALPRQADIAMYKAKQSHHSKIQVYNQTLESVSSALVSNQILNKVVNSIHTGKHMQMHFQPILATDKSNCYYEALVRVQNGEELVYPDKIFAVVERRRLEVELDRQVIQKTLELLDQNKIPKGTGVSINISGKTLLQPDLIELFKPFREWLPDYKIVIEVTENFLIDHMDYAQTVLNQLRYQGFLIALDDFGSGYSSIRYLAHMPVDIIKFDMSMLKALKSDNKTRKIILATAEMIRQAGFDLVMEGIEDNEMFEEAKDAGATHVQGYLFGKPKPEFSKSCV
ncbi:EAL domain-containing protein [Thiomicrorhabdus sp. ZW0627]|uniref:putative bifunctional diguanylate cyclase/phosphodiesterase n=1 Tax=Thiomicrorhabdus sp. ZW0627 TaxID=3039774 RepID=UPI00243682A4|nr:GGDEF domain-containing phosphodiesterase [Thiomicrorhabdus sp. ZW0627]MDG6774050.1 EAL domain-containing protein [Thiomicrorhabdus sp. ZW0627]